MAYSEKEKGQGCSFTTAGEDVVFQTETGERTRGHGLRNKL